MQPTANPFASAAAAQVARATGLEPSSFTVSAPPKPEMGDYAVGVFPAAKSLKKPPPAIAAEVVEKFQPDDLLLSATAAGPFVNFKANRPSAYRHIASKTTDNASGLVRTQRGEGKTVCIDYSSPNISKHLAYHHIRSTVIGHALASLYRAAGYKVIGINHLGDWGTTHGMLLAAYDKWKPEEPITVDKLNQLYVDFRRAMKEDASLEESGRAWFKKLEDGDAEATRLWQHFRDISLAEFQGVYDLLGVEFDEVKGESAFVSDIDDVLELLDQKGLSSISDGALVVDLEADGMPPLLLRKQDGATLYATRDLAAAMYRWETYHFERSLYVVDRGQGLHFKQLFRVLEKADFDWASRCAHVSFGLVRIGGKKTGTRAGNVVLLKEVLAEAANRSRDRIREENPDMADDVLDATARDVGIGAIVFANLATQRDKDVDFDWDEILSVKGDSGPYVQYAHARCASILRKASARGLTPKSEPERLTADAEWQLAKRLLDAADIVADAAESNEPHFVSRYLLDLAADFSRWYSSGNQDSSLRVLCDDNELACARLSLVAASKSVFADGLSVLGIRAPDAM